MNHLQHAVTAAKDVATLTVNGCREDGETDLRSVRHRLECAIAALVAKLGEVTPQHVWWCPVNECWQGYECGDGEHGDEDDSHAEGDAPDEPFLAYKVKESQ